MKKMRKGLVPVLMTVLAVLCFAVAACAGGIIFKFETNGGNAIESMNVTKGEEITLPVPEREGYSFEGWFSDAELSGDPVSEKQTAEESRTFYAKWEKMYLVTLDVAGGSIPSTSLYLKKGDNLTAALKDYVPVKENFLFGEWLYGGKALNGTDTMPEEDITLTAHYMVGYTVERYLQSLEDPATYEKGENYVGYAYAESSAFEPDSDEVTPKGFNAIKHEGDLTQKVLSETPSENLFKIYFDRAEVRVILYSNYPVEGEDTVEVSGLYGEEVLLPESSFYAMGYCLTGWSKTVMGEDAIPSNYLNAFLFGGTDENLYYYTLEEDTVLYGVWTKGYIDSFESLDYIYHFSADAEEVYLERAGIFFKGEYDAKTNGFFFYDDEEEIILEGIFNDESGTFAYYVTSRQRNLSLYVMGTGLDPNSVLILDELNNVTYTQSVDNEQGGKTVIAKSEGTYSYRGGAEYEATFTSGDLAGTSFVFIQGLATVNNVSTPVFSIRDDASYSIGILDYVGMYQGSPLVYPQNLNAIIFDGYGVATINLGSSTANYYYRFAEQEDTFYLYDTSRGSLLETCKIVDISGRKAYCTYDEAFDNTFTSEAETLTLDGLYNATYFSGGSTVKGYYTSTASAFGGYIVTVYTSAETLMFHVYATQELVNDRPVIEYHFAKKALGYSEYYYKDDQQGVYYHYAPLIVLNESEEGEFSLYAIDIASFTSRIFVKVAEGTYAEENGKLHATITQYFDDVSYRDTPINISDLEEIVFDTAYVSTSSAGISPIAYWYSVKYKEEGEEQTFDTVYHEKEGESGLHAKLSLIAGLAILTYELDGEEREIIGSYTRSDNILVIITSAGNLALEMDDEDNTFIILSTLLGTVYAMGEDGVETRNEYIDFDGKEGAVYTVVTPAETEGEDATVTSYTGTFEDTGERTAFGGTIYRFKGTLNGDEKEFDFLLIQIGDTMLFTKHNEEFEGEYTDTGDSGAILTLDGYGFNASLSVGKNLLEGVYYVYDKEQKVIRFLSDSATFFFDVTDEGTFTQRGNEFASYLLMRNQGIGNEILDLDGHGNFTVFTIEEGEREEAYSGTYTYEMIGSTPLFTLVYTEGAEQHTIRGILSSIALGSDSVLYNTFVVYDEEIVTIFVNEAKLSVLALDGFGNAIRYSDLGIPELGQYVIINESLLYYANSAGTDACIYTYDLEKGTATQSDFTPRSYFTEDLEAMVFYSYGFMIYGGETQYYYNIKDGKVYLYHRDSSDPDANRYGFVEEEFGTFGSSITWKDKTYYVTNGYQLMFTRAEENREVYPVTLNDGSKTGLENLTFTPTGAAEFRVRGSVVIGGRTYSCYVERTLDEEEHATMTLILGSYRFALEVEYTGEKDDGTSSNTYKLNSMCLEQQLPSILYLANLYIYAMQGLAQPQNVFGLITILDTYNESGDVVSQQATGVFAAYSGLVDSEGEVIGFENVNYTLESGLYTVEVKGSDDVTYCLRFTIDGTFASIFGLYGYNTFAFTRVENLKAEGGYEMEIERVIATDSSRVNVGGVYNVILKKDGETIEATEAYFNSEDLVITHIVRTYDEQNIRTGATYYVIELTEKTTEGAEEVLEVPFLDTATVTVKTVTTVNGAESNTYADYTVAADGTMTVEMIVFQGAAYFAETTELQEDGLLHVTTKSGRHFTVDVTNHNIALVTE